MYLGSSSQMIQTDQNRSIYLGGLASCYKKSVVSFKLDNTPIDMEGNDTELLVKPLISQKSKQNVILKMGRFGHLAVYSKSDNSIYVFAGQQEREGANKGTCRDLTNDLVRLDLGTGIYDKVPMSGMGSIKRRIYSTGFIIGKYIFTIGGQSYDGKCLDEILQLDLKEKKCSLLTRETNKSLRFLKPICSSACVAAFYSSRFDETGLNLSIERITQDIDWSTALSLIKHEGIYVFGGRD